MAQPFFSCSIVTDLYTLFPLFRCKLICFWQGNGTETNYNRKLIQMYKKIMQNSPFFVSEHIEFLQISRTPLSPFAGLLCGLVFNFVSFCLCPLTFCCWWFCVLSCLRFIILFVYSKKSKFIQGFVVHKKKMHFSITFLSVNFFFFTFLNMCV
jgi:hypothetical protein